MSLRSWLHNYKIGLSHSAEDLQDPASRRKAWWHFMIFDHGVLRVLWSNFSQVAPGVFRANHPSPKRLETHASKGIRTILNLRGASMSPHYKFEAEACEALGLKLVNLPGLVARTAPSKDTLIALLDTMRDLDKPFLMHCKSGADRTSLAAAVYLLAIENAPIKQARKQFSPRFIHFRWTKTGVLDHILDSYAAAHDRTGIGFEDWLHSDYDGAAIQASFEATRR